MSSKGLYFCYAYCARSSDHNLWPLGVSFAGCTAWSLCNFLLDPAGSIFEIFAIFACQSLQSLLAQASKCPHTCFKIFYSSVALIVYNISQGRPELLVLVKRVAVIKMSLELFVRESIWARYI